MRLDHRVGVTAHADRRPRIVPYERHTRGRRRRDGREGSLGAADDGVLVARVARSDPEPEAHPREPREQAVRVTGVDDEPRRLAVVEDRRRMLDAAVRVEDEQFGARAGREGGERLRGQGVEPGQAVLARDREHPSVAERHDGRAARKSSLLGERLAEVQHSPFVRHCAGNLREHGGHQSARASRADACDASSLPRAAMSHAHSRC